MNPLLLWLMVIIAIIISYRVGRYRGREDDLKRRSKIIKAARDKLPRAAFKRKNNS